MKSRNHQPRLLYPAKLLFRIKGQTTSFPDKKKLKDFIITKPLLYELLEGLIKKKITTMKNNMAKLHIYQQLNLKNEANKNRDRIMDIESILMVARWAGEWSVGEQVKR